MGPSNTWILSAKAVLISTCVLSVALLMKLSVPLLMEFVIYEVPLIWSTLLSWLKPPYLYVVINGIIITIAASTRFHQIKPVHPEPSIIQFTPPPASDLPSVPVQSQSEFGVFDSPTVYERDDAHEDLEVIQVKPVIVNGSQVVRDDDENEFVISRSTWTPPKRIDSPETQMDYCSPESEKPLVSSRFGHRKSLKASPEGGRALRVVKPKRQETLESTWKAITDGRHVPLTRHLKKSETCRNVNVSALDSSPKNVKKSETFRDRTNYVPSTAVNSSPRSGGGGKLRKDASLSQDELNRRVEAFIKKFNDEMRLQRQESLNQYMEMVNRGAH